MTEADKVVCVPRNDTSSISLRQALRLWSTLPPDPIYPAIEAYLNTRRCLEWAHAEADTLSEDSCVSVDRMSGFLDHLWLSLWDSFGEFAETMPTTAEGLIEMAAFAKEMSKHDPDGFYEAKILSTLASAAERLRRSRS